MAAKINRFFWPHFLAVTLGLDVKNDISKSSRVTSSWPGIDYNNRMWQNVAKQNVMQISI